jgi:hypothetical protein
MNDLFTTAGMLPRSGVIVYPPTPLEPPWRVEYPYQMTLAAPGLMMPFREPGCVPRLAIGLPVALPGEGPSE